MSQKVNGHTLELVSLPNVERRVYKCVECGEVNGHISDYQRTGCGIDKHTNKGGNMRNKADNHNNYK